MQGKRPQKPSSLRTSSGMLQLLLVGVLEKVDFLVLGTARGIDREEATPSHPLTTCGQGLPSLPTAQDHAVLHLGGFLNHCEVRSVRLSLVPKVHEAFLKGDDTRPAEKLELLNSLEFKGSKFINHDLNHDLQS
jgi:hypothetical protein